jgi:hypothetical protein
MSISVNLSADPQNNQEFIYIYSTNFYHLFVPQNFNLNNLIDIIQKKIKNYNYFKPLTYSTLSTSLIIPVINFIWYYLVYYNKQVTNIFSQKK